ncbi:MAG: MBL fold metallo-hydrolase [Acidobacteria bacterium]|nr:MAG: MBL fold metallo-hydrolase [Acidobacteriota bacterium]
METLVLASGSSGNCALVRSAGTTILIDAGVSRLQICRRLAAFGISANELDAVVITHEHGDHVRGLDVLVRQFDVPVWMTAGTWSRVKVRCGAGGEITPGRAWIIGGLEVTPVATSHDAAEPVAFIFGDGDRRLGYCTDTGVFTTALQQRFSGVDLLLIEANHDSDLLRHGPYPWSLKQRIASRHGHLANHQTQEAIEAVASSALKAVVGLHLSAENNDKTVAHAAVEAGAPDGIPVGVVTRSEMMRIALNGQGAVMERRDIP